MTATEFILRLGPNGRARKTAHGWQCRCPAHEDKEPSLSVGEGAEGRVLVNCFAGCDPNAICEAVGVRLADLFAERETLQRRIDPSLSQRPEPSNRERPFDWLQCVSDLKDKDLVRLGNERWLSRAFCTGLHKKKLIGLYNGFIAFPVHNNGVVVGAHYRLDDGSWRYTPPGTKVAPFIIGDPATAKQIHSSESQWDMLGLANRTDLYQTEGVAFIATRGASNGKLVAGLIPQSASVLAWPQNDKAGEKWLADVSAHAGVPVAKALTPAQFKDLDEWTAASPDNGGARAEDIFRTMWRNQLVKEPATPKLVDLTALLGDVCAYLKRFVVFTSEAQPTTIALWVAHSWAIDAFDYTAYLQITSPEKQCGKSRVLDCLEPITPKAWRAISPSEAVLFRKIDVDRPTLLLDETDTLFSNGNDDRGELLRSLLNAGFERKAKVPRCIDKGREVHDFAVFCPKAFAGIGSLPDTVTDRCIPVRLRKKRRDESVQRFRRREAELIATPIREQLEVWANREETTSTLNSSRPLIPDELSDREADICEPLLAIADAAGGDWPQRAREALVELCTSDAQEESANVMLLSDIRYVLDALGIDRISTKDLLEQLIEQETDGPWAIWWESDIRHGNVRGPATKLARMLKRFEIKARTIRVSDDSTAKGYLKTDFEDSWERYCSPNRADKVTPGKEVTR
jgi:Protein of unknown function (DUF3631)